MKQLSGLDELFLALETNTQSMHVAALGIYDPSTAPSGQVRLRDILAHIQRRLDIAPVFRRRLVTVPFNVGRPYWVGDARIDLEYHVRHIALPQPGDWRQLCIQIARLHSQPLDRSKPLWQAYVIEGLNHVEGTPPGSFAMYIKFHHAAVDGDTSAQILRAMHTLISVPEHHEQARSRVVDSPPTGVELGARAVGNIVPRSVRMWNTGVAAGMKLTALVTESVFRRLTRRSGSFKHEFFEQLGLPRVLGKSRFDGAVSSRRMVEGVSLSLPIMQRIRTRVEGATINDVFLAVVGGAMRDYLVACGEPADASFAAGVPTLARDTLPGTDTTSQIGLSRVAMHMEIANPLERLKAICRDGKSARQTTDILGRSLVKQLADEMPTRMSTALIQKFLSAYLSSTVSNVRGPDVPMYLAGARLKRFYPLGLVMDGIGLSVSGFSYCDELWVTVVSCRKMLPDPEKFAALLKVNLSLLADAVEVGRERTIIHVPVENVTPVRTTVSTRRASPAIAKARPQRQRKTSRMQLTGAHLRMAHESSQIDINEIVDAEPSISVTPNVIVSNAEFIDHV